MDLVELKLTVSLHASNRYCEQTFGLNHSGMPQEVGANHIIVACFHAPVKEEVPVSTLKSHHPICAQVSDGPTDACFAAASRWCA